MKLSTARYNIVNMSGVKEHQGGVEEEREEDRGQDEDEKPDGGNWMIERKNVLASGRFCQWRLFIFISRESKWGTLQSAGNPRCAVPAEIHSIGTDRPPPGPAAGLQVSPTSDTSQSVAILMNRPHFLNWIELCGVHVCRLNFFNVFLKRLITCDVLNSCWERVPN